MTSLGFPKVVINPETDWDDKSGLPRLVIPVRFDFFGPFRPENPKTNSWASWGKFKLFQHKARCGTIAVATLQSFWTPSHVVKRPSPGHFLVFLALRVEAATAAAAAAAEAATAEAAAAEEAASSAAQKQQVLERIVVVRSQLADPAS